MKRNKYKSTKQKKKLKDLSQVSDPIQISATSNPPTNSSSERSRASLFHDASTGPIERNGTAMENGEVIYRREPISENNEILHTRRQISNDGSENLANATGSRAETFQLTVGVDNNESLDTRSGDSDEESSDMSDDELTRFDESYLLYGSDDDEHPPGEDEILKDGLDLDDKFTRNLGKRRCSQFYEEMLPRDKLASLLRSDSKRYKRCKASVVGSHKTLCKNMDPNDRDGITEIEVSGRSKCGKVFSGDEVAVLILNYEKYETNIIPRLKKDVNKQNKTNTIYGVIKGILKRHRFDGVDHPVLVCTLDESTNDLVKPLCKTVSKLRLRHKKGTKESQLSVYRFESRSGNIVFERYIDINDGNKRSFVFLVVYIEWEEIYPTGAILKEYRTENSLSCGMKILRLQHQIPKLYAQTTVCETKLLLRNIQEKKIPKSSAEDRVDYCDTLQAFTIDPPEARDLDDALSLEYIGAKGYRVGVHIADVTYVVKKNDGIDLEAQERATTFYPGQGFKPYHMLPEPVSHTICSLLPNAKRPTVSVFFEFGKDGIMTSRPKIQLTCIKSIRQFTYEEVQHIIKGEERPNGNEDNICKNIRTLERLATKIRKKRLGNCMYAYPVETGLDVDRDSIWRHPEAHYLVEEFMILANCTIAGFLSRKLPSIIPLRCQSAPSEESINCWEKENSHIVHMIFSLQGKCMPNRSEKIGLENIPAIRYTHVKPLKNVVWENLVKAIENKDTSLVRKIVGADELHPLQSLALDEWIAFQETAEYRCSGDVTKSEGLHFSLQMTRYVHFTSPIRRYADIIVHRLVHSALSSNDASPPYTQREVSHLCERINIMTKKARQFQKQCQSLIWGAKLKKSPIMVHGIVKEFSERNVTLVIPGLRNMPPRAKEVSLNLLNIHKRAEMTQDKRFMTLGWRRRLYNQIGKYSCKSQHKQDSMFTQRINPHQRATFIQQQQWVDLMKYWISGDIDGMQHIIRQTLMSSTWDTYRKPECVGTVKDVTSEVPDGNITRQSCNYTMSFSRGQILPVQLSAEVQRGVLNPSMQLFNMTNNIKYCLQHTRDPIKFLTRYSTTKTESQYKSETDYLRIWLPILEMESATHAASDDSATIKDVPVTFSNDRSGTFSLRVSFCEQRDIDFSYMSSTLILTGTDDDQTIFDASDFLCIEYLLNNETSAKSNAKVITGPQDRLFWIAHAQITSVKKDKNKKKDQEKKTKEKDEEKKTTIKTKIKKDKRSFDSQDSTVPKSDETENKVRKCEISFYLHKESPSVPRDVIGEPVKCSVEILQKPESQRRIESILKCLKHSSRLAKAIALSKKLPDLDDEYLDIVKDIEPDVDIPDIARNNRRQKLAIEKALTNSFTLIHGPPGTGKTHTGIKLVYIFTQINRVLDEQELSEEPYQVVFCGPSNKSVDLVAEWMKDKFTDQCPKMVRMYGTSLEDSLFPLPGRHFSQSGSSKDTKPATSLADISMHNLIRLDDRPHSEALRAFDRWFKEYLDEVKRVAQLHTEWQEGDPIPTITCNIPTLKDIKDYKKAVSEAVQKELQNYSVIFCTTAVATSPKFIKATQGRIFQLIIDENGMCTEPESIATIIATKAKQVVLIGDHKQLRPVVKSTHAAKLGLEKSLFERYSNKTVFLNFQYRMHPEICQFPSDTFYNSQLITQKSKLWEENNPLNMWYKKDVPLVFCHVEGEEEYLAYTTEEGNERSCSNKAEVDQVVKVFKHLVKFEKIRPEDSRNINIMTQYNAQRTEIKKALLESKFQNINVNTVVGSQGSEWNYVIFSTVRSLPNYRIEKQPTLGWSKKNLGFITDEHQINVALTRARRGLIIIGNRHLLACDPVWQKLIHFYAQRGCIVDAEDYPKPPPRPRTTRKKKQPRPDDDPEFYKGTDREEEENQQTLTSEESHSE